MEHMNCEQVRDWARQITQAKVFQPFEHAALYRHVATCDTCRGALIALALIEPQLFPPSPSINCADRRSELAAVVDAAVLAPGSEVEVYPALWWHLLSCQDCAEEYTDLHTFARAIATESVAVPTLVSPHPSQQGRSGAWIARLALPREFLRVALPSLQAQRTGVHRGRQTEAHLLAQEDVAPGFQATVGVRQESAEQWSVVITIIPPVAGHVMLKLGNFVQHTMLDAMGNAIIGPVPSDVLLAADGPDVEVTIQRDDAP